MEEKITLERARLIRELETYEHYQVTYCIDFPNSIEWLKNKLKQLEAEPLNYFENE